VKTLKSEFGLIGVILFAFGGAIVLMQFRLTFNPPYPSLSSFFVYTIGFLMIGLGLWFIALSGKSETKQTPS